jgi:WD40 repeat protein
MRRLVVTVLLAGSLFLPALVRGAPVPLVNTSHAGRITAMVVDERRGLLFSGGEDGTVRIWDLAARQLSYLLRVSYLPIRTIAVHPSEPLVSVLVGEELQTDTLVCWDWERNRRLFTIESDAQLLCLDYSPLGSYLVYSREDYNSLVTVDPHTGRVLPYLQRGFGIVSYFTIARNEGNIMTYQPSGVISYWEIATGRLLKQLRAATDLAQIHISPNNRFIAAVGGEASRGEQLVVVDVLTGENLDQEPVSGVWDLAFSPAGNEISAVAELEGAVVLKRWYFGGRFLLSLSDRSFAADRVVGPACLVQTGEGSILGDGVGTIRALSSAGDPTVFASDTLLRISDLAFAGATMAVASPESLLVVSSRFFAEPYDGEAVPPEAVKLSAHPNPLRASTGLAFADSRRLLLWRSDETEGLLSVLDTWTGYAFTPDVSFSSPIRSLTVAPVGLIVVEKRGFCRVLDPTTFQATFRYNSPGMNKLIHTFGDMLVGGKTSIVEFQSPLLQINQKTGETVPVPDSSLFIYDLLYSDTDSALFTLAVQRRGERLSTLLKMNTGYNFERSQVLLETKGEDLGASVVADDRGTVYTSLGYEGVVSWQNGRMVPLASSGGVPRRLYWQAGKLFSLNRDGTISVWDTETRELLADIYIFKDGSWAALTPQGGVLHAAEAGRRLIPAKGWS